MYIINQTGNNSGRAIMMNMTTEIIVLMGLSIILDIYLKMKPKS